MSYVGSADESERGFTLIELVIVVVVLGVIMAIAIPTFLSSTRTASSAAAQSNLNLLVRTENKQYVTAGVYLATGTALQVLQPNLPMGSPSLAAKNVVSAKLSPWSGFDARSVELAASDGIACWYIYEGAVAEASNTVPVGTYYATGSAAKNKVCSTALRPKGAPKVGDAAKGPALTWYTGF